MNRAILATGGIDSTLLMYEYKADNPIILTCNFGQIAWSIQRKLLHYHMNVTGNTNGLAEIQVKYYDWQCHPGVFQLGYSPKPEDIDGEWNLPPHSQYYIEGKNALMLCYALAYCAVHKIDELITGFEYEKNEWENIRSTKMVSDDTSPFFMDTMNILAMTSFSRVTRIRAPFYEQRMDKAAIVDKAIKMGINLEKTYSCYFWPGPCGKCDNCQLRQNAIQQAKKMGDK